MSASVSCRWLLVLLAVSSFEAALSPTFNPVQAQEPVAKAVDAEAGEVKEEKSRFWWFIQSSGVIGFCILCLSIYFVATTVRLFIELRPQVAKPPEEIVACEQFLGTKDFQGLYNYTAQSPSFYSQLVSNGIAELPAGLPEAREVMDRVADVETAEMEKKISMLAVLGTLGPMIGLVGTLKGMIASFAVIALSDTQLKSSEVAAGISEALLLTFEGVVLSVPAIYFFAVFRNRVSTITAQTLLAADEVVRRISQASRNRPVQHVATAVAARV